MVMTPMSKPFFWYFNHARGGYGYPEYLYINLIQKKSKKTYVLLNNIQFPHTYGFTCQVVWNGRVKIGLQTR